MPYWMPPIDLRFKTSKAPSRKTNYYGKPNTGKIVLNSSCNAHKEITNLQLQRQGRRDPFKLQLSWIFGFKTNGTSLEIPIPNCLACF